LKITSSEKTMDSDEPEVERAIGCMGFIKDRIYYSISLIQY
jgi:hypothetical protein